MHDRVCDIKRELITEFGETLVRWYTNLSILTFYIKCSSNHTYFYLMSASPGIPSLAL